MKSSAESRLDETAIGEVLERIKKDRKITAARLHRKFSRRFDVIRVNRAIWSLMAQGKVDLNPNQELVLAGK